MEGQKFSEGGGGKLPQGGGGGATLWKKARRSCL